MNLNDLKKWAEDKGKLDQPGLIAEGVTSNRAFKVKTFLKEIVNHCNMVVSCSEKSSKSMGEIERYINLLTQYGLKSEPKNVGRDPKNP
jgi:hypothetical protein